MILKVSQVAVSGAKVSVGLVLPGNPLRNGIGGGGVTGSVSGPILPVELRTPQSIPLSPLEMDHNLDCRTMHAWSTLA